MREGKKSGENKRGTNREDRVRGKGKSGKVKRSGRNEKEVRESGVNEGEGKESRGNEREGRESG